MLKNKGFSSLEMMMATLLSTLLFVGLFLIVGQFQMWCSSLNLLLERDLNLWLAPLVLSRWVTTAGNNRWNQAWSGVAAQTGLLELNSDVDGKSGFPDLELSSSFEALVLRSSNFNLQVKSGKGSFQPLLKNIAGFSVDTERMPLLSIGLKAVTDRPLPFLKERVSESVDLLFFLRNYRSNLFPEKP